MNTTPFFGFPDAAFALVFSCMGVAYATAKSGVGVASMGVMRPELLMKSIVPVVMVGVLEDSVEMNTTPFFGFLGAAASLVFSCMGAAYGTAKSGVGVASMGVMRPELVMKSIVPVVMVGVWGIYRLIIVVIIITGINPRPNLIMCSSN